MKFNNNRCLSTPRLFYLTALVTLLFVSLDLIAMKISSTLNWKDIFIYQFGFMEFSIAGYVAILMLFLGMIAILLGAIIRKITYNYRAVTHLIVIISGFLLIFFFLRYDSSSGVSEFLRYGTVVILGLFIVGMLIMFVFRRVTKKFVSKDVGAFEWIILVMMVVSVASLIFLYPNTQTMHRFPEMIGKKFTQKTPNILLIVMDTVRADALSCYGNPKIRTPNVDRMAAEGILFERALVPAPWTLPSHSSLFTGLYPSQHQAGWLHLALDDAFLTMAEYLSGLGCQTVGFSENPFVSRQFGLAQGFRLFHEMYRYEYYAIIPYIINRLFQHFGDLKETGEYTGETGAFFRIWIRNHSHRRESEPFFAFINFMAGHLPHYPRADFRTIRPTPQELNTIEPVNRIPERFYLPPYHLGQDELNLMHSLYLGDVAYLDSEIGKIIDFLRINGILDETIIIITSDHGENFGEHGFIEHQFSMHNTLLHVPLIIRYPSKIQAGARIIEPVSTIFLFRTLMDMLGGPIPEPIQRGVSRSLLAHQERNLIYGEYENPVDMLKNVLSEEDAVGFNYVPFDRFMKCVISADIKFIWSSDGRHEMYDLLSDWQENCNLIGSGGSDHLPYIESLRKWHESLWRPNIGDEIKKLSQRERDILRSLGYIR